MPLIAQICMVAATLALVAVAVMALRLLIQTRVMLETTNRSLAELPSLIADAKRTSARVDELLHAFSRITQAAGTGVSQLESLATRSSAMANRVLDEVERPLSQTLGVIRGIRFGASYLIQRWKSRVGSGAHTAQGDDHVGEQRWLDDGGIPAGSAGRSRVGTDLRANGG